MLASLLLQQLEITLITAGFLPSVSYSRMAVSDSWTANFDSFKAFIVLNFFTAPVRLQEQMDSLF